MTIIPFADSVRNSLVRIRDEREQLVELASQKFIGWLDELGPVITVLLEFGVEFGNTRIGTISSPYGVLVGEYEGSLMIMKEECGAACIRVVPPGCGKLTFEQEIPLREFILNCDLKAAAAGFDFVRGVREVALEAEYGELRTRRAIVDSWGGKTNE
jgi:hypothetical protein